MSFPRYPSYKDSGVEWLGNVPEHWEVKKISHIADLIAGFAFPSEKFSFDSESGIPLVRGDNVTEGWLRWGEKGRYWPSELEYDSRYLLEANDIVIQMDGSKVGKNWALVGKTDLPALLVQRVTRVRVKGQSPRFIYSLIANELFVRYVDRAKTDPAIPHITMRNIGDYWVPLPPRNEQTAIAEFLDRETGKIDELVAEQRRLMELLKEKRQAVISHAVTRGLNPSAPLKPSGIEWLGDVPAHWDVMHLRRLVKPGTSITYGIVQAGPDIEDGIPYIRTSDMAGDSLPESGYMRTTPEIDASYARSKVRPNDLVVAIRASLGKGLLVPDFLDGANLTQGTARICPGEKLMPRFLLWSFNSDYCQTSIQVVAKGTTFLEITLDALRRIPLAVPPLPEQAAIVERLDREVAQFDTLISEAQRAIDLLQERRIALISAAVTGQIDVRHWRESAGQASPAQSR